MVYGEYSDEYYLCLMHPYKHKTPIQLRFKDVDKLGHVNNANHLTYIELARIKYFEDVIGVEANWNQQQGIILAHISIDYKAPLFLQDQVFVYTRCSKLGKKSIELSWVIVREKPNTEEIIAQGIAVLVFYDYEENKTIEIPDLQKQKIIQFEGP
jgi:acyl-CoA thioester hydrolase